MLIRSFKLKEESIIVLIAHNHKQRMIKNFYIYIFMFRNIQYKT